MRDKNKPGDSRLPGRLPISSQGGASVLVEESDFMMREQRSIVQQVLKELAAVHQRERYENTNPEAGEELQSLPPHPDLQSQRIDGVDRNESPNPTANDEAARKLDNERREQEKEKQLRLGLAPTKSTAPKPGLGR